MRLALPVRSLESRFVYLRFIQSFSVIVFVLSLGSVLFGVCKFSIFINTVFAVFDLEEVLVEQEAGIRFNFLFLSK